MRPAASQRPEAGEAVLRVQRARGSDVVGSGCQSSPVAAGRIWDLEIVFGTNGPRDGRAVVVRDASSLDQSNAGTLVRRYVATVLIARFQRPLGPTAGFWCQSVPETTGRGESTTRFDTAVRIGVAVVVRDAECSDHRRLSRRGLVTAGLIAAFQSSFAGAAALGFQRDPEALGRVVVTSFFFGTKVLRSGRAVVVRDASSFDQSGAETRVWGYVATVLMVRSQRRIFLAGDFGFQRLPDTIESGASEGLNATFVLSGTASVVLEACPFAHNSVPAGIGILTAGFGGVQSCGICFLAVFGFQRSPVAFASVVSFDIRTVIRGDL